MSDDVLSNYLKLLNINIFRGSLNNVLSRYLSIAKKENADYVVRITGDCPLVDSSLVDQLVEVFSNNNYDYVSNTIKPTYPEGIDIEIFSFEALEIAHKGFVLVQGRNAFSGSGKDLLADKEVRKSFLGG